MRALPYHDRIDMINSYLARNATHVTASPYNSRAYAPAHWRNYSEQPNIIAGFSTRCARLRGRARATPRTLV